MSKSKNWIYTQDLEGRKLMPGERAEAYITDIIKRTNKLGLDDTQVMQYIIRGLSPQLKGELISHNPSNLAETIERVYLAESALKLKSQETVQHLDTINHLANITTTMNTLDKKIEDISKGMHQTSTHDRQHPQQRQQDNGMQYPARQQRQNVASGGCYICGKNHLARHCWYRPGRGQLHRQLPNHQYERPWRPRNNSRLMLNSLSNSNRTLMRTTSPSPGMRQSQTTANETRNPSDSRAPRQCNCWKRAK